MKKKLLAIVAFTVLSLSHSFGAGNDVSKDALNAFSGNFANATEVKWEKETNYYKASFRINGQSLRALVSEDGKIIAVSKNILSTDLPLQLQGAIVKNLSAYWISELVEYAVDNETRYYITVESGDYKAMYQSVGTYDWDLLKKIPK